MIVSLAEDILRGRTHLAGSDGHGKVLGRLLGVLVVCGLLYGGVMGSFGGLGGDGVLQVLYSALKVPLLVTVTFGLSLPSFFVLNTLVGLREDFGRAVGALVSTQAGLTVVLAALAPYTAMWYASSGDYHAAILFNAVMFAVASVSAQVLLRRLYRPLIRRDRRHLWLLRGWLVTYGFVGIQMAWMLRPFVGSPNAPAQFFREEAMGNAYVKLGEIILSCFGR